MSFEEITTIIREIASLLWILRFLMRSHRCTYPRRPAAIKRQGRAGWVSALCHLATWLL